MWVFQPRADTAAECVGSPNPEVALHNEKAILGQIKKVKSV